MKTMYYNTRNYIRHQGNLVDLGEYRRKREMVRQDSPVPEVWEEISSTRETADVEYLRLMEEVPTPTPRERRRAQRARAGWALDIFASLSVVAMTMAFTITVIMG